MARPGKQRRAPAERPKEILEAALDLFVEKGFAGTRLDDVAARAGLSKAAIYLYFEDKTALFQGVVRQTIAVNVSNLERLARAHQGPVAVLIPALLEFLAGKIEDSPMPSIAKLVIAESRAFPAIGRFYLDEVISQGTALFEGLIARGIAQGEFRKVDPMLTVRSMIGPMLLSVIWKTVFEPIGAEPLDSRALARHHADLMLHALRAP
jgi:AcrR family transcriptional regulator